MFLKIRIFDHPTSAEQKAKSLPMDSKEATGKNLNEFRTTFGSKKCS